MNSTVTLEVLLMNPYYRYKKEKFLEKYQSAYDNLEDLKESISEYKKSNNRLIRRAMFAFFQDFTEYIIINDGKLKSTTSSVQLIEKASEMNFFDETLKNYLVMAINLRNRYTHDYYQREDSEKLIQEFCFNKLATLSIFLEQSKDKVILKYKE